MATKQYKILTKAQARARRFGEKHPEVSYFGDDGQPISIVDPAVDDLKEDEVVEEAKVEEKPKAKKSTKKKAVDK
ncbi:MAG: hypothetical protein ACRCX2_38650 [Paraclostridium sp.]